MSKEEQHAEANKIKDEGTALFKEKMFNEAMAKYEEAQEYVEHDEAMVALWVTCKLNAAQVIQSCHINLFLSRCTFSDTLTSLVVTLYHTLTHLTHPLSLLITSAVCVESS